MKVCKKCNIEKPSERFRFRKDTLNYSYTCKECETAQTKATKGLKKALLSPKLPKVKKKYKKPSYKPIYNDLGLKQCGKCKEFKSTIQYAKALQSPDLIAHVCSKCRYGNDKEVYDARWGAIEERELKKPRAEKITTKKCFSCKTIKDKSEFDISELGFLNRICKNCPTAPTAYKIRNRKRNRPVGHAREQSLKKYGITLAQYDQMIVDQNNCCKICDKEFIKTSSEHRNPINVDHCHNTGKVRGLLCSKCNTALGNFNDNEDILLKAIEYLKNSK